MGLAKAHPSWLRAVAIVGGLAGVLAFVLVPLALVLILVYGGSAMNGHADGGRYFVEAHSRTYEVSGTVYTTMLWVERAAIAAVVTFITCALLMAVGGGIRRR